MKKVYSGIVFLIFSLLVLFLLFKFTNLNSLFNNKDGVLNIVTSSNANANLVKYIAQDMVNLHNISFSTSSHDFEAKPLDIKKIEEADVVFYNGLNLDDKILDFHKDKNKFVKTTEGSDIIKIKNGDSENETYDPHVWLSLKEFKVMGKNILNKLSEIDNENKEFYVKNYNDLVKRADLMYESYKRDFDTLVNREFVSNHASYGYLSRDFNLKNESLHDINNHGEVNSKDIQRIIEIIKSRNIRLIIGDDSQSNKELETILNETGVMYKTVNTLESSGDYFTEYEKLLSSIYDGLK